MNDDMDEIAALQTFRNELAAPPAGLKERLEEQLMQHVLAEEELNGRRARRPARWRLSMLARQGSVAAVAASLVVGLAFYDGRPGGQPVQAANGSITEAGVGGAAGVLDQTAENVLGFRDAREGQQQSPATITSQGSQAQGAVPAPAVAEVPPVYQPAFNLTPAQLRGYPVVPGYVGEPSLLAAGPASMTPQQMKLLPTDPRTLLIALRVATAADYGHDTDFGPFRVSAYYLTDPDVPVVIRASFYRALALMSDIDAGGSTYDVFGRQGVVVARLDRSSGIRQQYLIDPDNGQLLEHREFTTRQGMDSQTCAAGTVVAIGVFDDRGFQVMPDAAPYARWPQVVPECAAVA